MVLTLGRQRSLLHEWLRQRKPNGGDRGRLPRGPARRPPLENAMGPTVPYGGELQDAGPEQHGQHGAQHPPLEPRPRRGRHRRAPELVHRLDPHGRRLGHQSRARDPRRSKNLPDKHLHPRTTKSTTNAPRDSLAPTQCIGSATTRSSAVTRGGARRHLARAARATPMRPLNWREIGRNPNPARN
jgi:hypothetical protein